MVKNISIKVFFIVLSIALSTFSSKAADTTLQDAIVHTEAAIEQGKMRYDKEFIKHAKLALKIATSAYRNMTASFSSAEADTNAHKYENIKFGIAEIKDAIGDEKNFHVTEAVIHAEKALRYFQSAPK